MYKKLKAEEVQSRTRVSVSRFEKTPEWSELQKDLDKKGGLKKGEVAQVQFSEAEVEQYGLDKRRLVVRFLQKYIEERELPYKVKSFQRDGSDFYVVRHAE